ncbi:hypothetical protein HanOQP8_Chr00c029g0717641 [Helianthus annuus]|nr:hypothetical protein HanOQP8_Chr00c029g0717641 [Helianthus annuus]
MDFKHPPLNSPFIQMTKTLIRFQNTDNVLSLSWFSFSLSNGFWLSVLLVSRVSKSTFRRSWLGFRPNSSHTGFNQACVVYGLKEAVLKGEGNHYMIADLDCLLLFFFVN